jgi:hypothetical protein
MDDIKCNAGYFLLLVFNKIEHPKLLYDATLGSQASKGFRAKKHHELTVVLVGPIESQA